MEAVEKDLEMSNWGEIFKKTGFGNIKAILGPERYERLLDVLDDMMPTMTTTDHIIRIALIAAILSAILVASQVPGAIGEGFEAPQSGGGHGRH
jgi:hypothetical protein